MKRMIISIVSIILFVVAFSGCMRDDNGRNAPGITPLPTAVNPDITTDMTPDINSVIPGVSPMLPDGVTYGISPGITAS